MNTLKSTSDAVIEKLLRIIEETGHENGNGTQNWNDYSKAESAMKENLQIGRISKCQFPGLDYVVFVRGSGPHIIHYDRPPKEIIVSRKCAEAVLRGAQVEFLTFLPFQFNIVHVLWIWDLIVVYL